MKKFYITSLEPGKEKKYVRLWRIRYPIGEHYSNGQPRCSAERFRGTYTAAVEYATAKTSSDEPSVPSLYTVEQWCTKQNELEYSVGAVTYNTYAKRRDLMKAANLHVGNIKLHALTSDDILRMLKELADGNSPSGKPLSGTSLQNIRSTLRYLLQTAVDARVIPYNPAASVKPPKNDTDERKHLNDEQFQYLRSRLNVHNRYERAILFLIELGLREGEVCGLLISDLHEDGYVYVHQSMQKNGVPKETKTGKTRYIKMSDSLRYRLVKVHFNGDYICGNPDPLRPSTLGKWWRRHRAEFGLDGYSLHEIGRHTVVSQLVRSGASISEAQAVTGQSTRTLLDTYNHFEQKQASGTAVDALERIRRDK